MNRNSIEDNQVLEELLRCSSDSESDDLFQDDTDNDPDFTTDGLLGDASRLWSRAALCRALAGDLGLLLGLLGQEHGLDVGQYTSLGDGDTGQELVQLLVIPDGQLKVTGNDPGLLVVTGRVTGQLENLGGEILHDGGQVDRSSGTHSLGVVALAEQTVDPADREL
ncbi:hypothetical protein J6590_106447 [Homalodisca vitripennis]|nr:hypothetical protein J6590_106447 [Homalodisca vitripennis]